MEKSIINLNDERTRLEMTAKPYAIFKSFTLNNISENKQTDINLSKWGFAKVKEDVTSNLIVDGDIIIFESLQDAFKHGEKNQLIFF